MVNALRTPWIGRVPGYSLCAPRSTASKGEEGKVAEFATRVTVFNALLYLQKKPIWVPAFEYRPFGLIAHGALGKRLLAIFSIWPRSEVTARRCLWVFANKLRSRDYHYDSTFCESWNAKNLD